MMYDFLIVGGGIAGVSAAARLSALGSVLVLETEDSLGYHASGRSAAMYEPNYGLPSINALSHVGEQFFEEIDGGVLSPRGIMIVGRHGEAEIVKAESDDFELSPISVEQAANLIPILDVDAVETAAVGWNARDIDTDRLLQSFARQCRANGGEIRTGEHVSSIEKTSRGWTIRTKVGEYTARNLMNAAGAWADFVAGMAGIQPVGVQPFRRSVARIPAPDELDVSDWPMLFGTGENWYAKPDAGQLIVSPAEEFPMEPHDVWAEDLVIAEGIERYSEVVTTEVTRVTSTWAGLRSFAPDRTLVIGPDPDEPAFFWIAGQGGYGFQTSAGASQLVSDLVGGQTPDLDLDIVHALDPKRFRI